MQDMSPEEIERAYELYKEVCRHRGVEPTVRYFVNWLEDSDEV